MNIRDSVELPRGGFVFAGQAECERSTLVKGTFVPAGKTVKALTECVLMKFKQGGGQHVNQRRSVINETFESAE